MGEGDLLASQVEAAISMVHRVRAIVATITMVAATRVATAAITVHHLITMMKMIMVAPEEITVEATDQVVTIVQEETVVEAMAEEIMVLE